VERGRVGKRPQTARQPAEVILVPLGTCKRGVRCKKQQQQQRSGGPVPVFYAVARRGRYGNNVSSKTSFTPKQKKYLLYFRETNRLDVPEKTCTTRDSFLYGRQTTRLSDNTGTHKQTRLVYFWNHGRLRTGSVGRRSAVYTWASVGVTLLK